MKNGSVLATIPPPDQQVGRVSYRLVLGNDPLKGEKGMSFNELEGALQSVNPRNLGLDAIEEPDQQGE